MAKTSNRESLEALCPKDIPLVSGGSLFEHPGQQWLSMQLEKSRSRYRDKNTTRAERKDIREQILDAINDDGWRVLRWDPKLLRWFPKERPEMRVYLSNTLAKETSHEYSRFIHQQRVTAARYCQEHINTIWSFCLGGDNAPKVPRTLDGPSYFYRQFVKTQGYVYNGHRRRLFPGSQPGPVPLSLKIFRDVFHKYVRFHEESTEGQKSFYIADMLFPEFATLAEECGIFSCDLSAATLKVFRLLVEADIMRTQDKGQNGSVRFFKSGATSLGAAMKDIADSKCTKAQSEEILEPELLKDYCCDIRMIAEKCRKIIRIPPSEETEGLTADRTRRKRKNTEKAVGAGLFQNRDAADNALKKIRGLHAIYTTPLDSQENDQQVPHIDPPEEDAILWGANMLISLAPMTKAGSYLKPSALVYVPYGKIFLFPARLVHAGGFLPLRVQDNAFVGRDETGCLRMHYDFYFDEAEIEHVQTKFTMVSHPENYPEAECLSCDFFNRRWTRKGID